MCVVVVYIYTYILFRNIFFGIIRITGFAVEFSSPVVGLDVVQNSQAIAVSEKYRRMEMINFIMLKLTIAMWARPSLITTRYSPKETSFALPHGFAPVVVGGNCR